jgi:hypothetical protein
VATSTSNLLSTTSRVTTTIDDVPVFAHEADDWLRPLPPGTRVRVSAQPMPVALPF